MSHAETTKAERDSERRELVERSSYVAELVARIDRKPRAERARAERPLTEAQLRERLANA